MSSPSCESRAGLALQIPFIETYIHAYIHELMRDGVSGRVKARERRAAACWLIFTWHTRWGMLALRRGGRKYVGNATTLCCIGAEELEAKSLDWCDVATAVDGRLPLPTYMRERGSAESHGQSCAFSCAHKNIIHIMQYTKYLFAFSQAVQAARVVAAVLLPEVV